MLGFFPTQYPEETLYSEAARYSDVLNVKALETVNKQLFCIRRLYWPAIGITSRISYLISNLPTGHKFTIEDLALNHSLVPYFRPFLPTQYLANLVENGDPIPGLSMPKNASLKYCPLCLKTDKELFGESYWHRVHQVPEVLVCPTHNVFLVDTHLPSIGFLSYITLEKYLKQCPAIDHIVLDGCNIMHAHLRNIAQDSYWLLLNQPKSKDLPSLRREIKLLFENSAWINEMSGTTQRKKFKEAFVNYYSSDFLEKINCSLAKGKLDWFNSLIRDSVRQPPINPLRCLLFFRFFGQSAKSFFTSERTSLPTKRPFGSGPWPCLNRVSSHYMDSTIQIVNYNESRRDAPGTFECPLCGYTYRYRASSPNKISVVKYGPVWEKSLFDMADDPSITNNDICEKFSFSISGIRPHIRKLKMKKEANPLIKPCGTSPRFLKSKETKTQKYRELWKKARNDYPNLSVTQLSKKFRGIFEWLWRYDQEWLNEHKPSSFLMSDWNVKDKKYLQSAKNAVSSLLSYHNPIRLSMSTIYGKMGLDYYLDLKKLPYTREYLESVVEAPEDFVIRRLKWATQQFVNEGVAPSRYQLLERAKIHKYYWEERIGGQVDMVLSSIPHMISDYKAYLREAAATLN